MMNVYRERGIYEIVNSVDGGTYVGQTKNNFGDRWDCHRGQLRGNYHSNAALQDAWNEYGENAFDFKVLHILSDGDDIDELERMYIRQSRETGICYNVHDGGKEGVLLGKHLSNETKRKIGDKNRINMTGRKASEHTKRKMSESQKKRYCGWTKEDREQYGRMMSEVASGYRWSEEAKAKFKETQRTKPNGAKYNVETVREIRRLHEIDGMTVGEIASLLGMNKNTVYSIATYTRWKNV